MKNLFRVYINDIGMTLVEVIIALAILGIISIGMLSLFTSGIRLIIMSGDHSKIQYTTIQSMENELADNLTATPSSITAPDPIDSTVTISFPGTATSISVDGCIQQIKYNNGAYQMTVSTFVPD
jgi:prepilin-type N-terminal cleavage/methylation domain-containing protein